jgi:hypothetical protein
MIILLVIVCNAPAEIGNRALWQPRRSVDFTPWAKNRKGAKDGSHNASWSVSQRDSLAGGRRLPGNVQNFRDDQVRLQGG